MENKQCFLWQGPTEQTTRIAQVGHLHKGRPEDRGASRLYARKGEKASSGRGWRAQTCRNSGKIQPNSCRAWIRSGGVVSWDHIRSGQSSRAKGKPLTPDDCLVPKCCRDQLPAFGGVLGAGFFFTVASPETKTFTGYFLCFHKAPKSWKAAVWPSGPSSRQSPHLSMPLETLQTHGQPHEQMSIPSRGASGGIPGTSLEMNTSKMLKCPFSISVRRIPNSLTLLLP